jgi:hypothetical protein
MAAATTDEQTTNPRQLSSPLMHSSAIGKEIRVAHASGIALLPLLEANAGFARHTQRIQVQKDASAAVLLVNK